MLKSHVNSVSDLDPVGSVSLCRIRIGTVKAGNFGFVGYRNFERSGFLYSFSYNFFLKGMGEVNGSKNPQSHEV